ncbi:MAG: nucleoside permease nupX [Acidobacteriota bacterium]|nr:nucleoside permease nupX [Acidobacteriota bacterium]MDH3784124.1 nucleoside permease nupX [Acidobacteriota bacterium]
MSALNLVSLLGCLLLMLVAWLSGGCKRPVSWRTVGGSFALMLFAGVLIFWLPASRGMLVIVNDAVIAALSAVSAGADFLLGPLALAPGSTSDDGTPSIGFVFAAQVLPAVIFFAALMALLRHYGLIHLVVRLLARLFHRTLRLSGAEALVAAANLFFGVEASAAAKPYLKRMTRSELLTVLGCGMSTVASTTMAIYVLFLQNSFPRIAGHLISASFLSIPAAALISKLMLPESVEGGAPETAGSVPSDREPSAHEGGLAALASGATDGLRLAAGISTLLIAVLGLVGLADLAIGALVTSIGGQGAWIGIDGVLGTLFYPFAWMLGIEAADLPEAARLLGQRIVMTEVVSYRELGALAESGAVSARTQLVLSYALCGFAHLASVGIFVGGITAIAPDRRNDLAGLGPRALLVATLATLLTGAVAGLLYVGQTGLL